MACDQCFPSEPFVMPIVGQFLGAVSCFCRSSGPPATFFEKTGTLSLICRRNQSHHYINDRV